MLEEKVVLDKIEILETGHVQLRYATKILKDGVEIAKTYLRRVIDKDSDGKTEEPLVADLVAVVRKHSKG